MQDIATDPEAFVSHYKELVEDKSVPFPVEYLAQELGLNASIVRRRLGRHGITAEGNRATYERAHLIGEVSLLRRYGVPIPEIARKLGLTVEKLLSKADYLKNNGYVDFDLRDEWESPMRVDTAVTVDR